MPNPSALPRSACARCVDVVCPQGRGLWLLPEAAGPILGSMTHCTITLRGVPIGEAAFDPAGELITVPVHTLPAYGAIRPIVRAASLALADAALGRDGSTPDLRAGAELGRSLELRDQSGALIAADFVDLTEWPGGNPEVAAIIRLRHAFGPVPAVVDTPPRAAGGGAVTGNS